MVEAQRALLDELMGTARNLTAEERKAHRETRWDDKEVCGCFLVKFCPHELFVNTKSDLGPCPKIHDPKLKESYEQSTRHDFYVPRFEAELFQFCEKLIQDLDRKVRRGRERLAQDIDNSSLVPISTEKSDQLVNIEESIKKFLEEIETFGEEGKVDEAEALMKKVDVLNIEKAIITQQNSNERGLIISQEKKMALCETCGSFLVANDATERTQSHITGKQHVGYGLVREYVIEYQAQKEKARQDERAVHDRDDIYMNQENGEKEKDLKEKENFVRGKERDRERERYQKTNYHCRKNERASPKRVPTQDQGNRRREQDHHSKRECDYESNSKKYSRSDWNQLPRRQLTRPSESLPNSIMHTHHFAPLNYHPRRCSHSPDHRV